MYPFMFSYLIHYKLEGKKLYIKYEIINQDDKTMYFGLGGHPCFRVPIEDFLQFEDYYMEFHDKKDFMRVGISEIVLLTESITIFTKRKYISGFKA